MARVLLEGPERRHWGYQTSRAAGVSSGAMYPMLRRWHAAGWLTDGWENPAGLVGRPPRRYYLVTDLGRQELPRLAAGTGGE